MTLYKRPHRPSWEYNFYWMRRRYTGSTRQLTRKDAETFVKHKRDRLRRQAAGLESADPIDTPRFVHWAKKVLQQKTRTLKRPDLLERDLRVMLQFWGARPAAAPADPTRTPYHDLRLGHPIADPSWMAKFEDWLQVRFRSPAARNHARSALSVCYRVALLPMYRSLSRVTTSPCDHLPRERTRRRLVVLSPTQIQAWISQAAPHVRLALAIGALAPKLRLANVLGLRWEDCDADLTRLTVRHHKTDQDGLPLVVPISAGLQRILAAARGQARTGSIVRFRRRPVHSLRTALKSAAAAAGVPYGLRSPNGATYHTLRHSIATLLAQWGLPEAIRRQLMGHADVQTTQIYTHLAARDEVAPLEDLSTALALDAALAAPARPKKRRSRTPLRTSLGSGATPKHSAKRTESGRPDECQEHTQPTERAHVTPPGPPHS
jgi:integrase/recombinase XerD